VTELVTGLDLVAWQIRVAAGERLPAQVLEARPRGHAIEVRIYAEDPNDGFRPVVGSIGAWRMPTGPGVRVDAGVAVGSPLPVEYDPLLAKVLVHADSRPAAVARLRRALDETLIGGVQTDLSFLHWLVEEPGFVAGEYDTDLVAERWGHGPPTAAEDERLAAFAAMEARLAAMPERRASTPAPQRPWAQAARRDGLRRAPRR
jgi:acetyl/propionyl-CoA carboxylase alpha subunit